MLYYMIATMMPEQLMITGNVDTKAISKQLIAYWIYHMTSKLIGIPLVFLTG